MQDTRSPYSSAKQKNSWTQLHVAKSHRKINDTNKRTLLSNQIIKPILHCTNRAAYHIKEKYHACGQKVTHFYQSMHLLRSDFREQLGRSNKESASKFSIGILATREHVSFQLLEVKKCSSAHIFERALS